VASHGALLGRDRGAARADRLRRRRVRNPDRRGGGFILTPVLLLLYLHDSAQTLIAISLAAVFFNAASGSAADARQRRIDYRSGLVFALATLPGAIGGAVVAGGTSAASGPKRVARVGWCAPTRAPRRT
jgi:hypothetical protein